MPDSEVLPFDRLGRGTIGLAVFLAAISVGGFLFVASVSQQEYLLCDPRPTPTGHPVVEAGPGERSLRCRWIPPDRFHLREEWRVALTSILGTILVLALVTLAFEFRLRRRFGDDLLRFLNLRKSLVVSGLTDINACGALALQ